MSMLCSLNTVDELPRPCFTMEMNGTFNFSMDEAFSILVEHQSLTKNVNELTEYTLIVIYALLILTGLFANIVVSFVVARRPQMHTARNLFIVNLTLSDMTLCVICMPFTLLKILRRQWSMGEILCKLVPVLQGTNILVSVGTITVIALDRYFTIVHAHDGTSRARVVCSIVCVWLFSLVSTLPICFYQVVEPFRFQSVVLYEMCIEIWPSQELKILYSVCILLVQAVIPALVVGVVHARISAHLHTHAKTQRDSRRAQRELARNQRTTMLLSVVAILFAVSWLPIGVFSLVSEVISPPESSHSLYVTLAVCHVIAMSSAVSNPVMYGWMNSNIRQELTQLLPAKWRSVGVRGVPRSVADEATTLRTAVQTTNCHKESITLLVRNGEKVGKKNEADKNNTTCLLTEL